MADPGPEADTATLWQIVEPAVWPGRATRFRAPWAYLVAGLPGAGKSRLAEDALKDCHAIGGTPIRVDRDKLRAFTTRLPIHLGLVADSLALPP